MAKSDPLQTTGKAKGGLANLKPFPKGKSGNPSGRKKKTVNWKAAENELREALPRVLLMTKNELQRVLQDNPTGAEMLAAKYIHEHVPQAVDKFLGKTPTPITGKDGAPLIPKSPVPVLAPINFTGFTPEQLNAFIEKIKPA